MTTTDDELLALARAATPGPWGAWDSLYYKMKAAIVAPGLHPLVTVAEVRTNFDDAKFLAAASPDRVIALVERVRELREDYDDAVICARDLEETLTTLRERLRRAEEALRVCADPDFGGPGGISIYAAATNELPRRQKIAAAYFKPAGEGE